MTPAQVEAAGLGLEYGTVRLVPTRSEWRTVAAALIDEIRAAFGAQATGVEHIGSTAVDGIAAKPIVDIAVRLAPRQTELADVVATLTPLGYQFRGDAGGDGGLVFVFEVRARFRIAHVHVVAHDDPQWARYLAFVARLRTDADARAAYERVKQHLATEHADDGAAYTAGKNDIVDRLVAPPAAAVSRGRTGRRT